MYIRAANTYRKVSVASASPNKILDECYVRIFRDLDDAQRAIDAGDAKAKGQAIGHASALLDALIESLDHKVAPQITKELEKLYRFAQQRLFTANVEKSVAILDEARKVLQPLHEGFRAAMAAQEAA